MTRCLSTVCGWISRGRLGIWPRMPAVSVTASVAPPRCWGAQIDPDRLVAAPAAVNVETAGSHDIKGIDVMISRAVAVLCKSTAHGKKLQMRPMSPQGQLFVQTCSIGFCWAGPERQVRAQSPFETHLPIFASCEPKEKTAPGLAKAEPSDSAAEVRSACPESCGYCCSVARSFLPEELWL